MSTKSRKDRAWAEVDLGHLIANARTIQATAGCDALLPMIKAEAYGLGALAVARALDPLDPWDPMDPSQAHSASQEKRTAAHALPPYTPP